MKLKIWSWALIMVVLLGTLTFVSYKFFFAFSIPSGEIIFYTDTHITDTNNYDKFTSLVNWANSKGFSYGFALGDNIDDPAKPEQKATYDSIDSLINFPHTILTGNHDGNFNEWSLNDLELYVSGNTCFAIFNSYNGVLHGSWRQDQVEWLIATMNENIGVCNYFVLASHHGIYDDYNYEGVEGAVNSGMMRAVLESHVGDYEKIVHYRGHNGEFKVHRHNGIEYITVPEARQAVDYQNPLSVVYNSNNAEDYLCYLEKHTDGRGGCKYIDDNCFDKYTCTADASLNPPSCISDWSCGDWSSCDGASRTRICIDLNGCESDRVDSEVCTISCTPDWECGEWSDCIDGIQTRGCTDYNSCEADKQETQTCTIEPCVPVWEPMTGVPCIDGIREQGYRDISGCEPDYYVNENCGVIRDIFNPITKIFTSQSKGTIISGTVSETEAEDNKMMYFGIASIVLLLVVAGVAIYYLMRGKKK